VKFRRPSPSLVISCIALFVAMGGTSVAAINYARTAGAVDGKSAVASSVTLDKAAGKLVATASRGPNKGRIPGKFLAGVPVGTTFGAAIGVQDNATGSPISLGGAEGIGTLSATCIDQDSKPAVEDPQTTLSFNNTSGAHINVSKRVANNEAAVLVHPPGTVQTLTIKGSNTFTFHIQHQNVDLLIEGVVRQDGAASNNANCTFWGTIIRVG
jgi:hypothetical protein